MPHIRQANRSSFLNCRFYVRPPFDSKAQRELKAKNRLPFFRARSGIRTRTHSERNLNPPRLPFRQTRFRTDAADVPCGPRAPNHVTASYRNRSQSGAGFGKVACPGQACKIIFPGNSLHPICGVHALGGAPRCKILVSVSRASAASISSRLENSVRAAHA